ncbi:hypothetical protein BURPS1710b_2914 [Burkholderia pseudomallei 1710b]|uniref:Uncharacterized protein n=1 Tax=Burkholderia pseudomallei (strain 1710b) TaxID=320372 RepID=Q3JQ58_BURP1|nr:hypothetical protein BURPS1710b_2914 [Burkholderia pseudomallei 1710b]
MEKGARARSAQAPRDLPAARELTRTGASRAKRPAPSAQLQLAAGDGRLQRGLAERRAEAARDAIGQAFLDRVVDEVGRLQHVARDSIGRPVIVGEAELDALRARPEKPGENVRRFVQARAAAVLHRLDELRVDLVEHFLRVRIHLRRLRRERIEEALVLARRMQAPLDAQLAHQAGEAEPVHQHADRADDARLVDVDLVRRRRDVVAARRAHVGDDDVKRLRRILLAQPPDLVVDDARLHRAAARAVDLQHDADRARILERAVERRVDVLGVRVGARGDLAVDRHDRRVAAARELAAVAGHAEERERERAEHGEEREAKEDPPAPRGALLLDRRERDALEHGALPTRFSGGGVRSGGRRRIGRIDLIGHA